MEGQKFGRLLILNDIPSQGKGELCNCRCDCGNIGVYKKYKLISGHTTSCGCKRKESCTKRGKEMWTTHGMSKKSEWKTWSGIRQRCENPNYHHFHIYGGRGISVCSRWKESFENFYADMGPKPTPKHSIDRIDNNGNYEPHNCIWNTGKKQCRNKRNNLLITYGEQTKCAAEWSEIVGIGTGTIQSRFYKGWSSEKILFHPINDRYLRKH